MAIIFRDAKLVDIEREKVWPDISVKVERGRIVAVGGADEIQTSSTDQLVACEGRYMLPGLMDMHIHLRAGDYPRPISAQPPHETAAVSSDRSLRRLVSRLHSYLYCGVTSVYDAGNDGDVIFPLRDRERGGTLLSPRIFCAGPFVTCRGGHGSQFGSAVEISALSADRDVLEAHIGSSPDLVKVTYDEHNWGVRPLIPILDRELLSGIIEFAHEAMLRVAVHASSELRAREAIWAGADSLAHPVIQSPVTSQFNWLLAAKKIPVVSTLAIGERYFRLADNPEFVDQELYSACIPSAERERLKTAEHEMQKKNRWADWMRVMTPVAQANLRSLVLAGGLVATGTDLSLGPELLRELELLQAAGLTTWQVLRSATMNGAIFLGKEKEMGSVAVGKLADLLLVDVDPSVDVSDVRSVSLVVKGGQIVDRSALLLPVNGNDEMAE